MKFKKLLFFMFLTAVVAGCKTTPYRQGEQLYTSYNMWYERPTRMRSVNYQKGTLIPAGTPVSSISTSRSRIVFDDANSDINHLIAFEAKFFRPLRATSFCDRLFTEETLESRISKMTDLEKECIREGVVKPGISKEAVLICYGYPPSHKTPSLDSKLWRFWRSRFITTTVAFDDNGIVVEVK